MIHFTVYSLCVLFLTNCSFTTKNQHHNNYSITQNNNIDSLAILYKNSGNAKADAGLLKEAIEDYTKAINISPYFAIAHYNRAIAKVEVGDIQGAIIDYTKTIEINPSDDDAYYGRAISKANIRDYKGAIADYTKVIELNSKYKSEAYYGRGLEKSKLGNKYEAIEDYNKAIEINSQYASAYYNRGVLKLELGDNKNAIYDYTKALESNPQHLNAYINRALSKGSLGDVNGEISDYRLGIKMCKDITDKSPFTLLFNNLGRTLYDLKRFKESAEAYGEGIKMIPNDYKLYYGRGLAKYKIGDEKGACQDWKKSSELGCEEAKNLLPICKDCD